MQLTIDGVKKVFLDVIHQKISFEEASAWASKMMQLEESEQIECDEKDIGKIFDGLTYLIGMDLIDEKGSYFYSISTLKKEFDDLFINNFTTHERIENAFIEDWNPLCLKNDEDTRKKYYSYASTVYKLLLFHKSEKEIFDYLWSVETEKMGLKGNKEKTKEFVKKLIDLSHDYFN